MNTVPCITDSHCHLDFPDFDGHLPNIVENARALGVHRMVTICTKLKNEPIVRGIAEMFPEIFYAAGTHPMSADTEPMVTLYELVSVSKHPKCVGIGETGLDYHYTKDSADIQKTSLAIHIEAAQGTGLPLIIHSRAADEDMALLLSQAYKIKPFSCVMHCFSSSAELAQTAVDLGFYLSMSGIAAFPRSQELRDIFRTVPLDRILLETDSPYLAPPPYRGKRNEPAYTHYTAKVAAEMFEMDYADFAEQTERNFERLFTKAPQFSSSI